MNRRKRFFLPSSKNTFGRYSVARVLCDSRCSSHLLPIASLDQMKQIFANSRSDDCKLSIKLSRNVGGKSGCLVVEYLSPFSQFQVALCRDSMGSAAAVPVKQLRFSLCLEDIRGILADESLCALIPGCVDRLRVVNGPEDRRTHALLGQEITERFCRLKYEQVELYIDPQNYHFPKDLTELRQQIRSLADHVKEQLPDDFNDWEDDDFGFEDDDVLSDSELA